MIKTSTRADGMGYIYGHHGDDNIDILLPACLRPAEAPAHEDFDPTRFHLFINGQWEKDFANLQEAIDHVRKKQA